MATTPKARLKKIARATQSGGLGLRPITNLHWHTYRIDIERLVWARNMCDGWDITVNHCKEGYIGNITIDSATFPTVALQLDDDSIVNYDVLNNKEIN